MSYLPPLPVEELPKDGESRFDWRDRSVSQLKKKIVNNTWYPDHHFDRIQPEKQKLTWGDTFYEELERYRAQCVVRPTATTFELTIALYRF